MANYYGEARAHKAKIKEMENDNKRRAERKAEIAETQVEHPLNYFFIEGRSCKIHRNTEHHANLENGVGLIPWNGKADCLIDRFDGRALLDFYREPDASMRKSKTSQEEKLEQSLNFESFRDAVRLAAKGLSEQDGLAFARQENIEIRAAMRAAATAAAAAAAGQRNPVPLSSVMPAGQGMYGAVGFSYGGAPATAAGGAGGGESSSSDDSDSSDGDSSSEEGGDGGPPDDAAARQEAEDDRVDDIAEQYGLVDFQYRLHRALEQEGEEEARLRNAPRRRVSRKGARERAKRMAGQGLDPCGVPMGHARDWTQPPPQRPGAAHPHPQPHLPPPRAHREARDGDAHRSRRSRSRSRSGSRSPSRQRSERTSSRPQFITMFSSGAAESDPRVNSGAGPSGGGAALALPHQAPLAAHRPAFDRAMFERDEAILDALPDQPDPAATGAQPIPLPPTTVAALRAAQESERRGGRDRGGRREREREREERERERERDYHGYSYRRRHDPGSRSRSRSRERDRGRERREEEGDRGRQRWGGTSGGGGAGGAALAAAAAGAPAACTKAAAARPGSASGPGAPPPAKETPAERLKRIMAAQLNKQAQKDHVVSAQRRLQEEKDKVARAAQERVVLRRSPSPPRRRGSEHEHGGDTDRYNRGRSRSRSPRGQRRRSRSR